MVSKNESRVGSKADVLCRRLDWRRGSFVNGLSFLWQGSCDGTDQWAAADQLISASRTWLMIDRPADNIMSLTLLPTRQMEYLEEERGAVGIIRSVRSYSEDCFRLLQLSTRSHLSVWLSQERFSLPQVLSIHRFVPTEVCHARSRGLRNARMRTYAMM